MRAGRSGRAHDAHGFTLLELALVLALIGLIATLVVPRLDVLSGAELDSTSRSISQRIRYLREEAARRGVWIRMIVEPANGIVRAEEGVESLEGWSFVPGEGPWYQPLRIPESLRVDLDGPGVRATPEGYPAALFAADGFADPAAFRLVDESGRVVSILVEPARTRPRIVDGAFQAGQIP